MDIDTSTISPIVGSSNCPDPKFFSITQPSSQSVFCHPEAIKVAKWVDNLHESKRSEGSLIDGLEQLGCSSFPQKAVAETCALFDKSTANYSPENSNAYACYSSPGSSTVFNTPVILPSCRPIASDMRLSSATDISISQASATWNGKQIKRPLSPDFDSQDDMTFKRTKFSHNTNSPSTDSSPPMSVLTSPTSTTHLMEIDEPVIEESFFSSEEKAFINQLKTVGFPQEAVMEALCVCNGNEELTIDYLVEQGFVI
ncbi:hypothetical protein VKT23_012857 [Stygiomarasmius scandens]|uniref:UBA domain-containing protein n=1 Tax=Marasmiellus scandens TaxID=2682957 RepID=A0ABR1J9Z0_9AGAR